MTGIPGRMCSFAAWLRGFRGYCERPAIEPSVIAYLVAQDDDFFLCVLDDAAVAHRRVDAPGRGYYRFPVNQRAIVRLNAESAGAIAFCRGVYTDKTGA